MTAVRIDRTNMLTQVRQNFVDLIDNKSNVADPTTATSEHRKWIYAREPDVKAADFAGFPYIVIHLATASFGEMQSLNRKSSFVDFTQEIEVVTSDREFGDRNGKGAEDMDAMSDDILETLNSVTNRNTLRTNGINFVRPNVSYVVDEDFKNTKIYRRSFIIPSRTRMQVSA